jgi:Peptidase propeptide and YPEB domain
VNHQRVVHAVVALVAGSVLAGGIALAQAPQPQINTTPDQARAAALAAYPGTVLETELDRYSGRAAYEIKVQPQAGGPAIDVHVDASTGTVLGTGEDNEPDSDHGVDGAHGRAAPAAQTFQDDFNLASRMLSDTGEARYFVLRPGHRTVLAEGDTQLTITVLNETREINGTRTRVVEERQETAGQPTEIARNFFAIDANTGDVFYFGEEVDVYAGGVLTGHPGAWLATGGNRPGLIMPGTPVVGMRYYQEIAPGLAMDRAEVISTSDTCRTPAGTFAGCLVTRESSAIEDTVEQKAYAPGIGLVQDQALLLVSAGYVDPGR